MKKMLVAAASLVTGALLVVTSASAQPSSGSSLQLVVLSPALTGAASTQAHYGSQVTFNVQTGSDQPWVSVTCSQNGQAVYGQYWGFWADYSTPVITNAQAAGGVFTLGSTPLWSSGAASCTATLYTFAKNGRQSTLSSLDFGVSA